VEYVRQDTVSLLAALEMHSGKVQTRCVERHVGDEFIRFLDQALTAQRGKRIHGILGNLSVHKTATIGAWGHPRVQLRFTPIYTSSVMRKDHWGKRGAKNSRWTREEIDRDQGEG
jgi:hypothetical protein